VVREAVQTLRYKDYSRLGPIMASPERSLPLLRKAVKNAPAPEGRLRCAHVLGMMGDAAGADVLIEAVRSFRDFEGKDIGYYYPRMTWLDSYLLALGATRDPRALKPILEKLELLGRTPDARPSHIYCIALALEALGDHGAAPALATELKKAGGTAGAALTLDDARRTLRSFTGLCGFLPLELARSLFHCGDHEGLARKALETFASDVRGPIALHARGVLKGFPR